MSSQRPYTSTFRSWAIQIEESARFRYQHKKNVWSDWNKEKLQYGSKFYCKIKKNFKYKNDIEEPQGTDISHSYLCGDNVRI